MADPKAEATDRMQEPLEKLRKAEEELGNVAKAIFADKPLSELLEMRSIAVQFCGPECRVVEMVKETILRKTGQNLPR